MEQTLSHKTLRGAAAGWLSADDEARDFATFRIPQID
jgi:hypothetical protein